MILLCLWLVVVPSGSSVVRHHTCGAYNVQVVSVFVAQAMLVKPSLSISWLTCVHHVHWQHGGEAPSRMRNCERLQHEEY